MYYLAISVLGLSKTLSISIIFKSNFVIFPPRIKLIQFNDIYTLKQQRFSELHVFSKRNFEFTRGNIMTI